MITGNIPSRINYYLVGDTNPIAFPCDADKPNTNETAKQWQKNKSEWYHNDTALPTSLQSKMNNPQTGYRIYNLEYRDEGGRAYKMVTPEGYTVDLREDVLLDTILNVGISPGGILNGDFIWATVGSQFKLIRVGSEMHKDILNNMQSKKMPKLTRNNLEAFTIYKTASGNEFLYLGRINGEWESGRCWAERKLTKQNDVQLWLSIESFIKKDQLNPSYIAEHYFCLERVKDKKVVEKTGQIPPFYHDSLKNALKIYLESNLRDKSYCKQYYEYEVSEKQ